MLVRSLLPRTPAPVSRPPEKRPVAPRADRAVAHATPFVLGAPAIAPEPPALTRPTERADDRGHRLMFGSVGRPAPSVRATDPVEDHQSFRTNRGLPEYLAFFPGTFTRELEALDGSGHWVDMGSGEGVALSEYRLPNETERRYPKSVEAELPTVLDLARRAPNQRARATGVTYKMSDDRYARASGQKDTGLVFLRGRRFEDVPLREIERGRKADLITDLYGVFAYSKSPSLVLQRYVDLLSDRGVAYIFFGSVRGGGDAEALRSQVERASGEVAPILDWLKSLDGVSVDVRLPRGVGRTDMRIARITKVPGERAKIPTLEYLGDLRTEPNPPWYRFRERAS